MKPSGATDLETYPWPGSLQETVRSILWTALFCLAIGLLLWGLGVSPHLGFSLASSFCIGGCVWSAHALLHDRLEAHLGTGWCNLIATTAGLVVATALLAAFSLSTDMNLKSFDWGSLALAAFFGVVGTAIFSNMAQVNIMERALAAKEIERLESEQQLNEARLKTLQAQIEPHFLFNTLSNVKGLVRSNPAAAEDMLQQLTTLLRHALSRTREEQTTLGEELDLLQAYLGIQQIRMGDRLSFAIRCPAELRPRVLPPMLIQPLVENAVLHGIEPGEAGGRIDITVSHADSGTEIKVADTGCGLDTSKPSGTGLNNVRQRLQTLFGSDASLQLSPNVPTGVTARVRLP